MNPEIERFIKLQLTPQRALAGFFVLLSVIVLAILSDLESPQFEKTGLLQVTHTLSGMLIAITTVVLMFNVGNQLNKEISSGAWDWVRLSSLSSAQIVWSRILSAPLLWILFAVSVLFMDLSRPATPITDRLLELLIIILSSVLLSSLTVLFALHKNISMRLSGMRRSETNGGFVALPIIILVFTLPALEMPLITRGKGRTYGMAANDPNADLCSFFGFNLPENVVLLVFISAMNLWIYLALIRAVDREREILRTPWLVSSFAIFINIFTLGLGINATNILIAVAANFFLAIFMVVNYAPGNIFIIRRFFLPRSQKLDPVKKFALLPAWFPILLTSVVLIFLLFLLAGDLAEHPFLSAYLMIIYLLRDSAIIIYFNSVVAKGRLDSSKKIALTFTTLYIFVPIFLNILSAKTLLLGFFPVSVIFEMNKLSSPTSILWMVICPTIIAALFLYLCWVAIGAVIYGARKETV